jgi:cobalt-precorrin 5A hydrolase
MSGDWGQPAETGVSGALARAAEAGKRSGLGIWPVRADAESLATRLVRRLGGELFRPWDERESQQARFQSEFPRRSHWVLIMATGIATRFVEGLLRDKHHDPAVVVLDEAGRYAIALVGGHEAGANALAYRVANAINATPVVTTATEAIKPLVVGIGCRKGVSEQQVERAVLRALERCPPRELSDIRELVTVDLKASEPGLVSFAQKHAVPLRVIAKHQIEARPWVSEPSDWVRQSVGLDGVCEPCALIACMRGRLLVPKATLDGVAVAVVEDDWGLGS